ncbi:MAG: AraC family ligand binding domain-containing protein [Paludibacteraceae bacterium]|nr:AraC family ligand binding domain-containing protein [Paludibacteraceae bacterium]
MSKKSSDVNVLYVFYKYFIVEGNGWFESEHCAKQIVHAGTIIMLFPGEWHHYAPNPNTGWKEYWVGFQGRFIDERLQLNFFDKAKPLAAPHRWHGRFRYPLYRML